MDIELRIVEGAQATIDRVKIIGNDRTNEHVVRREIRTKPGQKFSRSDVIRSQRAIMALGYFNPETMGMNTPVNPKRGTVDIEYSVEERPSDQLELSAGWSAYGLIGTLGVVFNNFSTRNFFKKIVGVHCPKEMVRNFLYVPKPMENITNPIISHLLNLGWVERNPIHLLWQAFIPSLIRN